MLTCKKCGHKWYVRTGKTPKKCPKCGSIFWNSVPRRECPTCSACPNCNPGKVTAIPPKRKYTEAELNDPELFPEDCICRGAHRPDSTVCPVNLKGATT